MMTDPYENDIGMRIARTNREGDITFLKESHGYAKLEIGDLNRIKQDMESFFKGK
ncbi:hypothetical protein [Eikenella corrodens]|uniref:hypothetical protein n=1 Tax=Eikenella corrodens TaxID=539 RepID=UPI00129AAA97|nr:hypothetical protein [Eikenella corrodens]